MTDTEKQTDAPEADATPVGATSDTPEPSGEKAAEESGGTPEAEAAEKPKRASKPRAARKPAADKAAKAESAKADTEPVKIIDGTIAANTTYNGAPLGTEGHESPTELGHSPHVG